MLQTYCLLLFLMRWYIFFNHQFCTVIWTFSWWKYSELSSASEMSWLMIMILEDKVSMAYKKNMNKCLVPIPCWHKVLTMTNNNKTMPVIFVIYKYSVWVFPCRDIQLRIAHFNQFCEYRNQVKKWPYIKLLKHEILSIRYEAKHKLCSWLEMPPNPYLIKAVL